MALFDATSAEKTTGHVLFVKELLRRKPELAEVIDSGQRSSPLHLASARGYLEIVLVLTAVNPDMCLAKDQHGRNPVHVAATRGQVHVVDELIRVSPESARERTNGGETVLHLCVKYRQIDAMKFIVKVLDDGQMINSKDSDGNTVLHLAVAAKLTEAVQFLLEDKKVEKNAMNKNGLTAMDTLIQSKKDPNDSNIWKSLKRAKALRAKQALEPREKPRTWLEQQSNALMVVASLIATMAFQVGVNPPGGAWQQDDKDGHKAGRSIMADTNKGQYDLLLICNTVGLVSSLSVILLLISGLPCKRLFVIMLMIIMWIAVTGTALTYLVSVDFVSNARPDHAIPPTLAISVYVWVVLMIILLFSHVLRLVGKLIKQLFRLLVKLYRCCSGATGHPPV